MDDMFARVRAHCLAKPGAVQDEPWPGETVWKVDGKIFAMGGQTAITVKSTPDKQEALIQHPQIRKAAYVGRFGWVTVEPEDEDTFELALDLIDESYESVASRRKKRAAKSS